MENLSMEGVSIYELDSDDDNYNENFQEEIAKKHRFDRLLFPRDFPGANSKERMEHLISITEEVPGTNGGVRITKESVNEKGFGMTVGSALAAERERMRELWGEYGDLPYNPLVSLNYAMWIGDDLLARPVDYSYDRGDNPEKGYSELVQIGDGSLLPGLEEALLLMTQGSQHFVICQPQWAYGKWGILPRIPGNAVIVFQVYIKFITFEIEDRFRKMPMKDRAKIPLRTILATCIMLRSQAKQMFEKASEVKRKVNRSTGEETYKKTGLNIGNYHGAERSGELLNLAVDILERACLKNLDEEIEMRKMMINLHTDACLSWRKAKPILYKKGIEHGERCMLHFEELKEIFLRDEDEDQKRFNEFLKSFYSRLTRTRRNLMELYSRDIFNSFDDARRMYESFQDDLHDEDLPYKNFIKTEDKVVMKRMNDKINKRKENWLKQQAGLDEFLDEEDESVLAPADQAGAKGDEKFKVTQINAKKYNLAKSIEELHQEDAMGAPDNLPPGGSYTYYKNFIDDLVRAPDRTGHLFSNHYTSKVAIKFIIAYADSRGLKSFLRVCDGERNLVVTKDETKESSLLGRV
ncbi:Oidioi.mRNA.OKI2018_I69.chr1.g3199.t1.cds [Oikopleura dioica]|uniref:peptidylprolyl isomerase n=1 Tax=Oikopleura dioica TaxID=34765 RepID=A0ABN7SU17_OIKDI|nr:Oidioi.mRNA.OKI2018_I69.chr1.g3199.t1.cds [Oikopleura dioica]